MVAAARVVVGGNVVLELLVVDVVVDVVVLVVEVDDDVVVTTEVVADIGVVAGATAPGPPSPNTRNAAPAIATVTSPASNPSQRTYDGAEEANTESVQRRSRRGSTHRRRRVQRVNAAVPSLWAGGPTNVGSLMLPLSPPVAR